jgi:L-lactate dehydrogenase (cytochrome)
MEGSKMDFMMDGGVRTGRDVLIALTHGIKAVGLGRVCAAGLGAGGYAGMRRAFEIVCAELTRSMQLLGISSVKGLRKRGAEIRRTNKLIGDAYLPKFVF